MEAEERTTEQERLELWRYEQLAGLGFKPADAVRLAESGIDVHDASDLVSGKGCPPDVAARILL